MDAIVPAGFLCNGRLKLSLFCPHHLPSRGIPCLKTTVFNNFNQRIIAWLRLFLFSDFLFICHRNIVQIVIHEVFFCIQAGCPRRLDKEIILGWAKGVCIVAIYLIPCRIVYGKFRPFPFFGINHACLGTVLIIHSILEHHMEGLRIRPNIIFQLASNLIGLPFLQLARKILFGAGRSVLAFLCLYHMIAVFFHKLNRAALKSFPAFCAILKISIGDQFHSLCLRLIFCCWGWFCAIRRCIRCYTGRLCFRLGNRVGCRRIFPVFRIIIEFIRLDNGFCAASGNRDLHHSFHGLAIAVFAQHRPSVFPGTVRKHGHPSDRAMVLEQETIPFAVRRVNNPALGYAGACSEIAEICLQDYFIFPFCCRECLAPVADFRTPRAIWPTDIKDVIITILL